MRIRARWYATGELQDFVSRGGRFVAAGPPHPAAAPDLGEPAPGRPRPVRPANQRLRRQVNFHFAAIDDGSGSGHVVDACCRHGVAGFCPDAFH